jgi:hypothetical protein
MITTLFHMLRRAHYSAGRLALLLGLASVAVAAHAQTSVPGDLRAVVYHNAPFFIAENLNYYDQIWPVDYDGDEIGSNNVDYTTMVDGTPKVYYSVVETGLGPDAGYYLVGYYHYHVADAGSWLGGLHFGGHQHDMEGVWLVLRKSSFSPYGLPRAALTEAHAALLPVVAENYPVSPAPQGGWTGVIRSWRDNRYSHNRAVFGIAGRTHGTYVAETCNPARPVNPGMVPNSVEAYGSFLACIRQQYSGMIYQPELVEALGPYTYAPRATQLPPSQRTGLWLYALEEISQSALWRNRNVPGKLFAGSVVPLTGGLQGYDFFSGSQGQLDANPPWAFKGGPGEGTLGQYWYYWKYDGEENGTDHRNFQYSSAGDLLGGASAELARRFPFLGDVAQPDRFNPYVANPPVYAPYPAPPFSVLIEGPHTATPDCSCTWSANVTGGTPPYTYQWSGQATGFDQTVTASPTSGGDLYLNVYDSAGRYASSTYYVEYYQY